ncbi:MAG: hypothetical protein AAFY75_14310 [Pseudomonadota bacterium]
MSDLTHGPAPGFWRMLWRTGGALPLFLGVFTVMLTVVSLNEMRAGLAFAARGVEVLGQVMDRDEERVRRDDRWETDYYLTMRYETDRGPVEMRRKVRRQIYDASKVGTLRRVRHMPGLPHKVEFEIGQTIREASKTRWMALAAGLATLGTFWWKGLRAVDAIRARKFGAVEHVTVTGLRELRHKNGWNYRLQWIDDHGGDGESLTSGTRTPFAAYPAGTRIEVFRGVNGHLWWVGDVGPRKSAATVPSVAKR